ncbi:hypothetical protein [Actinomadura flavalba]|uniref:hypothetical protein n=1 Tax=Actinomadura flavalba TaxID=1120938 RepID=UPI00036337BF|nr:hypothetical protein [Actinomadura flavalba]
MTDEKQDAKNPIDARLDAAVASLARGRVVLGLAAFAAPDVTARVLGVRSGPDAGRDYVTRAFGAREIVLGAGYLLARGKNKRIWLRLGLAVDALDTAAGLKTRHHLPGWVTAAAVTVSGSAAAIGAAKVSRDLLP